MHDSITAGKTSSFSIAANKPRFTNITTGKPSSFRVAIIRAQRQPVRNPAVLQTIKVCHGPNKPRGRVGFVFRVPHTFLAVTIDFPYSPTPLAFLDMITTIVDLQIICRRYDPMSVIQGVVFPLPGPQRNVNIIITPTAIQECDALVYGDAYSVLDRLKLVIATQRFFVPLRFTVHDDRRGVFNSVAWGHIIKGIYGSTGQNATVDAGVKTASRGMQA